jgi:hypothetical protein
VYRKVPRVRIPPHPPAFRKLGRREKALHPFRLINYVPFMRWRRTPWFLALLALAVALVLTSCMNQEGIGPAEGELNRGQQSIGGGGGY